MKEKTMKSEAEEASLLGAPAPADEAQLEEYLSRPGPAVIAALAQCPGDLLVLGAGGKLGFDLCRLAQRTLLALGSSNTVTAVSRFADPAQRRRFADAGLPTIACDLLAPGALEYLPDAPNVLFLAGFKFGAAADPASTWALNTLLPGLVARRFPHARLLAFSTGNVYPLTAPAGGGADETTSPAPVGEYAQSCLGRERLLAYAAQAQGTPVTILRLNYANDLRYGVVVDLAQQVLAGTPIDVTMGAVNVIWQGDVAAVALRALPLAATPPLVLNVAGPETISVRWLAGELARRLGVPPPQFTGQEAPTALLNNAARQHALFGYPQVPLGQLIDWTAQWLLAGQPTLAKPTHFQERTGQF
jgi:nucleoside-diphosphate-sugar epimerase